MQDAEIAMLASVPHAIADTSTERVNILAVARGEVGSGIVSETGGDDKRSGYLRIGNCKTSGPVRALL